MTSRSDDRLLMIGLAGLLLLASAALADSPTALFWRLDGPSLADGGADVPGQISGTVQLERPTSLAAADRLAVRVDYTSQQPFAMRRRGGVVGAWDSSAFSTQLSLPLGDSGRVRRWHLGVQRRSKSDQITYREWRKDADLRLDDDLNALAAACDTGSGWVCAASWGEMRLRGRAVGRLLQDFLDLPAGTDDWPTLSGDTSSLSLGVSRRWGQFGYGLQYDHSAPNLTAALTRADSTYLAPVTASAHGWEGYVEFCRDADTYFLSAAQRSAENAGHIYVGVAGRGDLQWGASDRTLTAGWRHRVRSGVRQWVLDWRRSSYNTYDQGYGGLWPGLDAEVYALRSNATLTTTSLRYGVRWDMAPRWSLLGGLSLQDAQLDAYARLRQSQGFGRDPLTRFERAIGNGRLLLLGVTLGAGYRSDDWTGMLTYTAGVARANDAFGDAGDSEPDETDDGNSFTAQGFWTVCFEHSF